MPAELAAEILLRFVFETILYALGYGTGWFLVPTLSLGRYSVESLSPPRRGSGRVRAHRLKRPRQLSAEWTAVVGIAFWAVLAVLGFALW